MKNPSYKKSYLEYINRRARPEGIPGIGQVIWNRVQNLEEI